jgi:hypothetical protein
MVYSMQQLQQLLSNRVAIWIAIQSAMINKRAGQLTAIHTFESRAVDTIQKGLSSSQSSAYRQILALGGWIAEVTQPRPWAFGQNWLQHVRAPCWLPNEQNICAIIIFQWHLLYVLVVVLLGRVLKAFLILQDIDVWANKYFWTGTFYDTA